ncbi:MAG TPA: aminotransferase class IV [Galbitalea sp.]|jgi:branched-subunit amino acid aminotransferase/4-amino-4-deoxychorismate lyase|nr:aminotransferase class IV [Galbitalea sp.]
MSESSIYRWHAGELVPLDYCDMTDTSIELADSWLATDGTVLGLELHRTRFLDSVPAELRTSMDADAFWRTAIDLVPREGDWFPRVELQQRPGSHVLVFRLRDAPARTTHLAVATWQDGDPRTAPAVKGPDLDVMTRVRTTVQSVGASEAVILTGGGFVVEDSHSGLLWWRGNILCGPPSDLPRVDSVTVRGLLTLATALGIETYEETVTPAELADTELWSLNALHGIRIVTDWIGGPPLAQLPGRLALWRARMDALRKPF